jgi:regulator of sigma E protease
MVGEVAAAGMSQGIGVGLRITFQFLAFISIALAFGNLLPIPVLDGGQIVMYLYELISRKPLSPKQISRFQTVGAVIVLGLLGLAVFSDLLFITKG